MVDRMFCRLFRRMVCRGVVVFVVGGWDVVVVGVWEGKVVVVIGFWEVFDVFLFFFVFGDDCIFIGLKIYYYFINMRRLYKL